MRHTTIRNSIILASVLFGSLIFVYRTVRTHTRPKMLPTRGTVRRVIDGDTLTLTNGLDVRLSEIDAPELYGQRSALAEESWAELKVMTFRKPVRLVPASDHMDQYGRYLAYVFVKKSKDKDAPEIFVNAELVRRGRAIAKSYGDVGDRFDEIRNAEAEAKKAGRGIWAKPSD